MAQLPTIIGLNHPNDGQRWECQCARCGSTLDWEMCNGCGGDGWTEPGELYEQDPLWYDQNDVERCRECGGTGGLRFCLSGFEYCLYHPLPGRIEIPPSTPEWFVV